MESYKYQPIDLASDAIRILRLFSGHEQAPIACDLIESLFGEEKGISYQALSYTWGTSISNRQITLCGKEKTVMENLYSALVDLRKPSEDVWLWVDALCIDQENDREKTHQVGHMRRIYEKADRVFIWLGPRTDEIDVLMDAMIKLHALAMKADDFRRQDLDAWERLWPLITGREQKQQPQFQPICKNALRNMLARPWFRRVWILQEVFCARAATILCGPTAVSSEAFVIIPKLLHVTPDPHAQSVLDIMPGYLRRQSWGSRSPDLRTLIQMFKASQATDERDKIFALLGISSDIQENGLIQPDYSITAREVVQRVVWYLVTGQAPETHVGQFLDWDFDQLILFFDRLSSPFLMSVFEGARPGTLSSLLSQMDINGPHTPRGAPLLWIAAGSPSNQTVKEILGCPGININITNHEGDTALRIAAREGNHIMVEALLSRPDRVLDDADASGRTSLGEAAQNGHDTIVDLLPCELDVDVRGGDLGVRNSFPAIWLAAEKGYASIVKKLLQKGAYVDALAHNNHGIHSTPLLAAIYRERVNVVRLLLQEGASLETATVTGCTPLWVAAAINNHSIVQLLVETHRARLIQGNNNTSDHTSDVTIALEPALPDIVAQQAAMAAAKVKFLETSCAESTPLWAACENGCFEAARTLIWAGADIHAKKMDKHSVLWISIHNGRDVIARLLIDAGARLSDSDGLPDENGTTLLSKRYSADSTAEIDQVALSRLLVDAGMTEAGVEAEFARYASPS